MARRRPLSTLKEISEINMTPLMDLTFILLITFIITFPLIEQGISVNLPKANAAEIVDFESRSITLDHEGQLFLDDLPTDLALLTGEMEQLGSLSPDTTVYVRADEALTYGKVVEVMKILHQAHVSRVALVTQAEGGTSP